MNLLAFVTASLLALAHANTEKTVFVVPPSISYNSNFGRLEKLQLDTLNQSSPSLRKALPVAFPSSQYPHGLQSWYLLEDLNKDQRYEVRACWAATQPTNFWLEVFTPGEVLQNSELLRSIDLFIQHRQEPFEPSSYRASDVLLLRVEAAADFFTTNKTRMHNPPPVDVDIILDPFILNVFPSSLKQTALYIVLLAIGSYFISGAIWSRLTQYVSAGKEHKD